MNQTSQKKGWSKINEDFLGHACECNAIFYSDWREFHNIPPLKRGAECSVNLSLKRSVQQLVLVFMA